MENRTIDLLPMVRRMGRTTIQNGKLYLFWTASGIDFCFRGERISVVFTAGFTSMEQWISMELDGFFLLRMPLHRGETGSTCSRDWMPVLCTGFAFSVRSR